MSILQKLLFAVVIELQIVEKSLKSQMKRIEKVKTVFKSFPSCECFESVFLFKAKTDGQSQIEERALALREKIKSKDRLVIDHILLYYSIMGNNSQLNL